MELTLTPEVEALMQRQLASGRYQNPSELIAIALTALYDTTPANLAELDANVDEGLADIDRGDVYTEAEARAYLRDMRAKL